MDYCAMLARSLARDIDEESDHWSGVCVIGNRLSEGSEYYHVYSFTTDSLHFPPYWRDHFRSQLRKNTLAWESLEIDEVASCSADRRAELDLQFKMLLGYEARLNPASPKTVSLDNVCEAISFRERSNHEVAIFLIADHVVRASDESAGTSKSR